MFKVKKILLLAAILLMAPVALLAQESTFSDPNVEYSFALPEVAWKQFVKPSATTPNVEYVYNDRREGHFEVRKVSVQKDAFMTDIIRDEESKLQFLQGYVAGKEENFNGVLRGNVFNYEFVRSGRSMSGRFYFLRANDTTVYILRFTGERDRLKAIRNQTDSIARTFKVQQGKAALAAN
jgi:hypothetical protein